MQMLPISYYSSLGIAQVFHQGERSCVVNGAKNISKDHVCKVNVIICELNVFQRNNDLMYLSRGVSLWSKFFLVEVQYFVFLIVDGKKGHEDPSVEFVDSVGQGYGSIFIVQ